MHCRVCGNAAHMGVLITRIASDMGVWMTCAADSISGSATLFGSTGGSGEYLAPLTASRCRSPRQKGPHARCRPTGIQTLG
jgi:hypothetical protein